MVFECKRASLSKSPLSAFVVMQQLIDGNGFPAISQSLKFLDGVDVPGQLVLSFSTTMKVKSLKEKMNKNRIINNKKKDNERIFFPCQIHGQGRVW